MSSGWLAKGRQRCSVHCPLDVRELKTSSSLLPNANMTGPPKASVASGTCDSRSAPIQRRVGAFEE